MPDQKPVYWICAQPASFFYAWQVDAMLLSFEENGGVDLTKVHIVSSRAGGINSHFVRVAQKWQKKGVLFEYYKDNRVDAKYISSIRPHILKKHWQKYPWLEDCNIFYHDCDIALTKPLPVADKLGPKWQRHCFVSDTRSYIGAEYIQSKGHGLFETMCELANISPGLVKMKQSESGGAQYLLKPGIDAQFWDEVYQLSEVLFTEISEQCRQIKQQEPDWHALQIWCADMWAVLWSLWKRGYSTPCHPDLEFSWGTQPLNKWEAHAIFHNAGVTKQIDGKPFYKSKWHQEPPILAPRPEAKWASAKYFDLVERAWYQTQAQKKS